MMRDRPRPHLGIRSPGEAKRNPGSLRMWSPDFASFHPGYETETCDARAYRPFFFLHAEKSVSVCGSVAG
jgi:hypothetical protein